MWMRLAKMGWRNLSRNVRRTVITVVALAGGLALSSLTIVYTAGFLGDAVDALVGSTTGHVLLQHPGQVQETNLYDTLPNSEPLIATLLEDAEIIGAAPRLYGAGLLSGPVRSTGAQLVAVHPEREATVTQLLEKVETGNFPESAGSVALGVTLAERLEVTVGDEIVALSQAADGSLANELWEVVGLMSTGVSSVDQSTAWVSLETARTFFVLDGVHEVALRLESGQDARTFVRTLVERDGFTGVGLDLLDAADLKQDGAPLPEAAWTEPLDPEATHVVRSWMAVNPMLSITLESMDIWIWLTVGVILATAGMGAMNTLLMSVIERTRELGILMAVGMKPRHIVLLVVAESMALGVLSVLAGSLLGAMMSYYLIEVGIDLSDGYGDIEWAGVALKPIITGKWTLDAFTIPSAVLFVTCLLASIWPAIRAARMNPVDAIGRI